MSKIDDLKDEMKELSNKLDNALEAVANGTMEKSEARKISREANNRFAEIAKDYAKHKDLE